MKRLIGYTLALALVVGGCPGFTQTTHAQGFSTNFNFFFHRLSPFGRWVYVPRYGQVWYPIGIGPYWQPYTNGYWAYTEFGWTWVSYDEFGWIPFHYGAWSWLPAYGWVWAPGYVWAPAWVTWRYGPRYIGWAPLPPDYGFYYGRACPPVTVIDRAWVFVPAGSIGSYDIPAVRVPAQRNFEVLSSTKTVTTLTIDKGHVVNVGPGDGEIGRINKLSLRQAKVEQLDIKPQPVGDLAPSRQLTIATPYRSLSVTESGDFSPGGRGIEKGRPGTEGAVPKSGMSPRSEREEKFNSGQPSVIPEKAPRRTDQPRFDTWTRPEKPASDPWFTQPEPRREPAQKSVDQPRIWPNSRDSDKPSYRTMLPRTYDTRPQPYPSRPETVRPDPSLRPKSGGGPSGYPDRARSFEKTPRHVYQPEIKNSPPRPTGPSGSPSPRAGAPAKHGKQ